MGKRNRVTEKKTGLGGGGPGKSRQEQGRALGAAPWVRCYGCGREYPAYGMVRLRKSRGEYVPFCHECYERRMGGVWRGRDEYWDGDCWIPMKRGV